MNNEKFHILLFLVALISVSLSPLHAQRFQLYQTGTLSDAFENPYQSAFVTDKEKKIFFDKEKKVMTDNQKKFAFNFTTFYFNAGMTGPNMTLFTNFLTHYEKNLTREDLPLASAPNRFNNDYKFNFGVVRFKWRAKPGKRDPKTELTYGWQLLIQNQASMSGNFLNMIIVGNGPYAGEKMHNLMNYDSYTTSYFKITYGWKRDITEKLSLGINYHRYLGIHDIRSEITESYFYTAPNGEYTELHLRGQLSSFFNFKDSTFQKIFDSFYSAQNVGSGFGESISAALKRALLQGIFKQGGRGFSMGASYDITKKLTLTAAVKDLGYMSWNPNSVRFPFKMDSTFKGFFQVIYDTALTLKPLLDTSALMGSEVEQKVRYIDSMIFSNVTDTIPGSYYSPLPLTFELGGGYNWNSWLYSGLLIHKVHRFGNVQFTLLNRIRIWKWFLLNTNVGVGTENHTELGAQFIFESPGVDFYVGSEQIGNWFLTSIQAGADFHFGFAMRF
ncbi:MAG: hypothetical protein A3H98_02180 [Bacteroidetes bacterium RIFCSPLOWO2_02_FULL_36_8]|nr:MAG: hypothetical protein A3H98_02180 [Bacteroidetes bacterium RIFCSPLOWO2_02_FULL_36_8]OFY69201.1 MAG: hypothetical protein A3G23_06540 [Bacteroidetes bacterium RIFCSPLOWO2_12_FULL_37_12]